MPLALLEDIAVPRLAPGLASMANNKKDIERRIKMIKMTDFFKKNSRLIITIGVLGLMVLAGLFLSKGFGGNDNRGYRLNEKSYAYNTESLYQHKSLYIGDASNISNLMRKLPFGNYVQNISLKTETQPYGITVNYLIKETNIDTETNALLFKTNAFIMFALLNNLDEITFDTGDTTPDNLYQYSRETSEKIYGTLLWDYSKNMKVFDKFVNTVAFEIIFSPDRYTPAMSSTQGIHLTALYPGQAETVRYSTQNGVFLTWSGAVSAGKKTIDLPYNMPACWSPFNASDNINESKNTLITVTAYSPDGKLVAEKTVTIQYDGSFYSIQPSLGVKRRSDQI